MLAIDRDSLFCWTTFRVYCDAEGVSWGFAASDELLASAELSWLPWAEWLEWYLESDGVDCGLALPTPLAQAEV